MKGRYDNCAFSPLESFTVLKTDTIQKRFKIVTSKEAPTSVEIPKVDSSKTLKIYSSGKTIFVNNASGLSGFMIVYDLAGNAIQQVSINAYGITALPTILPVGAYIVKTIRGNNEVSDQVMIR